MAWSKPSENLLSTFERVVPLDPRAERRKMFGFPCCFAGGNMFMGLWQDYMVLRLPDGDRETMMDKHGAQPFEPMGRRMREYVLVPDELIEEIVKLRPWIAKSFAFALSLPEKVQKSKQPKEAKKPKEPKQAKEPKEPKKAPAKTSRSGTATARGSRGAPAAR